MSATVEEAATFTAFDSLLSKLSSSEIVELAGEKKACQKELKKWEVMLQDIQPLLNDAEMKQWRDGSVKLWLAEIQLLTYDLDDILDVFATRSSERKHVQTSRHFSKVHKHTSASFTKLTTFMFYNKMISKMKQITVRLENLNIAKNSLGLVVVRSLGSWRITEEKLRWASSVDEDINEIYGRNDDMRAIIELLLHDTADNEGVTVIPIVGMEGFGKTTVAQLVYNDHSVNNHFDLKAWVTVSDDFDVTRITKTILEGVSAEVFDATDLGMLQVKLKEKLIKKKFFIVLDDVQHASYADWEILRSPFQVGASGSKILVTTHNAIVRRVMGTVRPYFLDTFQDDVAYLLLARHALGRRDFSEYPHLQDIGKMIVRESTGLPLAAKTLGDILSGNLNPDAWRTILYHEALQLRYYEQPIEPALILSYRYLPSHLKKCFDYCSVIPRNYKFTKEEIVLLWMAEGFLLQSNNNIELENLGGAYFQELVARSFFMRSSEDKSRFVMHHLIHDLAEYVAGEMYGRLGYWPKIIPKHMRGRLPIIVSKHMRHISYDSSLSSRFKNLKPAENLRTFISYDFAHCRMTNDFLIDLLPALKFSRVLTLRDFSMSELPDLIGDLIHLRYLDFRRGKFRTLPNSICALHNLQTLLLRQCWKLEMLPLKIGNLTNLRHLDLTETISLTGMPIQIGELTNLRTLSKFVIAPSNRCDIGLLKNLVHLKGELSIFGLENVATAEDALEARLGDKPGLKTLKLNWRENLVDNSSKQIQTKVLDKLQPPETLEQLNIEGYGGTLFPSWLGDPSFSTLISLELINCRNCGSMPSVGELPLLRDLYIRGFSSLQIMGAEFYGVNSSNVFSALETLRFEDMAEWREWNVLTVNYPCLRELSITSCPKLSGKLPSSLPSLKKLKIFSCKELEVSVSSLPMLCELEIHGCKKLVRECWIEFNSLKKVTISNISDITCLTEGLISGFRKVKSLQIDGCEKLVSFCPDRKQLLVPLECLIVLNISNCQKLVRLGIEEDEEELRISHGMDHLNLSLMDFERVKKLPRASCMFISLMELKIVRCPKLVSFSEGTLPLSLKRLVIKHCQKLKYVLQDNSKDINIKNTSRLEHLKIGWCPSLISLSSSCQLSVRLQNQQIKYDSKLASSSSSAKLLAGIKQLRISHCQKLVSLSGEFLFRLQRLQIWNCSELSALSSSGKLPEGLKRLHITNCPKLQSVAQAVHGNTSLEYLGIIACINLQSLPQGLEQLENLQEIELVYCPRLTTFPESRFPTSLRELDIDGCENLQTLPNNLHNLTFLEKLALTNFGFPEEGFPVNLKSLSISKPKTQKALEEWELHKLTLLEQLMIEDACPNMVSFPPEESEMILPTSLVQLTLKNFPSLKFLSSKGFAELKCLKYLSIMDCPKVRSLPEKESLGKMYRLQIDDCPLLKPQCLWDKIAHIPFVRVDDHLVSKED